jgi:cold shock protein
MPTGTVKFFNESKGYGFITPDDGGEDIFFSAAELKMDIVEEITNVQFVLEQGEKGWHALDIWPILA